MEPKTIIIGLVTFGTLWMLADLIGILQADLFSVPLLINIKTLRKMRIVRLSIPGNACVHCGTIITENLKCSGCGWVDPLTKEPEEEEKDG